MAKIIKADGCAFAAYRAIEDAIGHTVNHGINDEVRKPILADLQRALEHINKTRGWLKDDA